MLSVGDEQLFAKRCDGDLFTKQKENNKSNVSSLPFGFQIDTSARTFFCSAESIQDRRAVFDFINAQEQIRVLRKAKSGKVRRKFRLYKLNLYRSGHDLRLCQLEANLSRLFEEGKAKDIHVPRDGDLQPMEQ
jgi:hypothetical protein